MRVLSVGQCAMDHGSIGRLLQSHFGAATVPVATAEDAVSALAGGAFDLVLVNRVFDRDGGDGLALLGRVKDNPATAHVPVMLVSNYAQYQDQAIAAGAAPGFGKAQLNDEETLEKLQRFLSGKV